MRLTATKSRPKGITHVARTTYAILFLAVSAATADEPNARVLFDFSNTEASKQWQTVNDGVMGGRSDGRFRVAENGTMEFFGTLSLENNGGFASVRSRPRVLGLQGGDTLVTRVKGDGRRYTMNLYVPRRRMAFSYRVDFQTKKDEWIEIRVPLKDFVATSSDRKHDSFWTVLHISRPADQVSHDDGNGQ